MIANASLRKILIVDDDQQSTYMLGHILKSRGYKVKSALSGSQGLAETSIFQPDLILLDIIMPEMDGYQVCEQLKKDKESEQTPVIFITASNDPQELIRGFEAGAVDFISKPFNKSELLARVNTHLELKLSRDMISGHVKALNMEIEQRKQTERKFRALSEMTFEAVIFLNGDKVVEFNKAAEDIFDFSSGDSSINDFFPIDIYHTVKTYFDSKQQPPLELVLHDKTGKEFFALIQHRKIHYLNQQVDVLAIRDISYQKEMDKLVFDTILETEEKERKRFSRDMHDGLGALLSTIKIYLNLLQKENKSVEQKQMLLEEIKNSVDQAIVSARTIANNIMPSILMDYGLIKALIVFIEALNKTHIIDIAFKYPEESFNMDAKTQTHIYRITLELINNTLKHAQANHIELQIDVKGKVFYMDYSDDGVGFDFQADFLHQGNSQGLKNIFSRVNFLNGKAQYINQDRKMTFQMEIPV